MPAFRSIKGLYSEDVHGGMRESVGLHPVMMCCDERATDIVHLPQDYDGVDIIPAFDSRHAKDYYPLIISMMEFHGDQGRERSNITSGTLLLELLSEICLSPIGRQLRMLPVVSSRVASGAEAGSLLR